MVALDGLRIKRNTEKRKTQKLLSSELSRRVVDRGLFRLLSKGVERRVKWPVCHDPAVGFPLQYMVECLGDGKWLVPLAHCRTS